MNTQLYDKYFDELINLFPSINEFINLKEYEHLNDKLENPFSEEHIEKLK